MTVSRTRAPGPRVTTSRHHDWLTIKTAKLTLRYRLHSGPFTAKNLRLGKRAHPVPTKSTSNLGGWRRALDLLSGAVKLNDGLLTRAGWYVLDDSKTALRTKQGFRVRPSRKGGYEDWYLFGYGHDYQRGLRDLRTLTGPTPLLPRSAFGVWFSRYWPYSESDYHTLIGQFRAHRVPLDTLSVDTDFKREADPSVAPIYATIAGAPGKPYAWNGWEWDTKLFPNPRRFINWAHGQGLSVTLNIHPSISSADPQWASTQRKSGGLTISTGECRILMADPTGECGVFDWTKRRQAGAYFDVHRAFERQGIDFFWLDWCCDGSSANAPGLTADTWINSLYAKEQRARGQRWPAFSRVGASYSATLPDDGDGQNGGTGIFAEHRYTIQFTGDTCATWAMLGFEARFTAEEGNVGLPYVSHDIGSFNGQPRNGQCSPETGVLDEHLPDDLYARWVAFGTFQPLDRLHSNHGDRLPWQYGAAANAAAASFLRLRDALNPYIYTLARNTFDTGLPLTGALYLQWPHSRAAYAHPSEYTFGKNIVVEPVTSSGNPARATIWVPPGRWVDYFTGKAYSGPRVRTLSVPLSQMPVLVRAGAIIPTAPYATFTKRGPQKRLILTIYGTAKGSFRLYDDQGTGFGYTHHRYAWTRITHDARRVTIWPAHGHFPGALRRRSWIVRLVTGGRVRTVSSGSRPTVRKLTLRLPR